MRRALIAAAVVVTLVMFGGGLVAWKYHKFSILNQRELASRPIPVPRFWANECSKIRRTIAQSGTSLSHTGEPLNADEAAIYKAVIAAWTAGSRTVLNVSNMTDPLDGSESSHDLSNCECLEGIDIGSIVSATHSTHTLTREILPGKNARLVSAGGQMASVADNDPRKQLGSGKPIDKLLDQAFASGLFSLSEIAFDKERRRALVSYSFVCGMLCGSGNVLLFEKINGEWKKASLTCGSWVS